MQEKLVYLALGSNLGNSQQNLEIALQTLPPQVKITAVSRLYKTAPAYVTNQPPFFNIAVEGQTRLDAPDLLVYLKELETQIGRKKTVRYGPRQIDIDIIFYDDLVFNQPHLHIPHPRMNERAFVLRPLADIAPNFVHPVLKQSVESLLADLPPDDGILEVIEWPPFSEDAQ